MVNRPRRKSVKHRPSPLRWLLRLLLKVLLGLLLFSVLLVLSLRVLNPPTWAWQWHRAIFSPAGYPAQSQHQWVPIQQIARPMQLAVIAAEDQHFPNHYGFDLNAIKAAFVHNENNRAIRGASTISQQTAKNLFLWPSRSYLRKGAEAWLTLLMETLLGKERILELYLNIVEFGPGIYGVEAASRRFYGKPAQQLNWNESARLAAVLPNPWQYRAQPPSPYVAERSRWILRQMGQLGYVTLNRISR